MQSVWVLQHAPCETLGTIESLLQGCQIDFSYIKTHAGEGVPLEMAGKAGLIVMGGPMGVYEQARYPFLRDELRLIESALTKEQPILGICLGSQLLAAALGAEVKQGEKKELGWHPVSLSAAATQDQLFEGVPPEFCAFHWHGDVFSLPDQALGLAASRQTPCQAFRYGKNAYGILFHMEVTQGHIIQMLSEFGEELRATGGDAGEIEKESLQHLAALQPIADHVFGRWAAMVGEARK